jgi:hypothetical protein
VQQKVSNIAPEGHQNRLILRLWGKVPMKHPESIKRTSLKPVMPLLKILVSSKLSHIYFMLNINNNSDKKVNLNSPKLTPFCEVQSIQGCSRGSPDMD